jgi:hypothetical protein
MNHHIEDFFSTFKNEFSNFQDSFKKNDREEDCITRKSKIVDSVEILSFSTQLHLYMGFYLFLWNQPFIGMCIYQLFAFILCKSLCDYNFFSFLLHPFFQNHMKDIVLPQTLYTIFDYYILTSKYNNYFILFMNMILFTFSNEYFKNIEHNDSQKVRTFINILIYFIKFSYIKIIYSLFN